jgi:hypothetical protein
MNEFKIDPVTGLAELPAGERWNVYRVDQYSSPHGGPGHYVKIEAEVDTVYTEIATAKRDGWFGPRYVDREVQRTVKEWRPTGERELIESGFLTAEDVARAAGAVMRRREQRAETEKLLGAYPPNRLALSDVTEDGVEDE